MKEIPFISLLPGFHALQNLSHSNQRTLDAWLTPNGIFSPLLSAALPGLPMLAILLRRNRLDALHFVRTEIYYNSRTTPEKKHAGNLLRCRE